MDLLSEYRIQHGAIGPLYVRLCNWLSLRRLVLWINHLPPACWSTLWKANFKHKLGCRFDILDSISSFFLYFDIAIIYVLIHHILFWLYLYFLNILYFFKYSCINIFHRRSLCTFYSLRKSQYLPCVAVKATYDVCTYLSVILDKVHISTQNHHETTSNITYIYNSNYNSLWKDYNIILMKYIMGIVCNPQ